MKRIENSPPPAELVIPSTGGHGSTSLRKSKDTRVKPSFKAFSPKEIQDATDNFSESLMIGHGGYGNVYKCQLVNWDVAVKILDDQDGQDFKEYVKEMEVLETMRHENLIRLMGTCFKFRALVYEYAPNGSLEDCLNNRPKELTWEIRTRIVYEICTALRFLHANKPKPIVHGDLKPHNVLLDTNFKVKLTDFGLCRYLTQGKNSKAFHHTLNVSGSHGYMDPDFLDSRKVTPGVDVYSFGKTVVRILTGRHPPDIFTKVHEAKKTGSFRTIVDPAVRDWPEDVVEILARFALKACKPGRNRSEFIKIFYSDLQMILDGIDNCSDKFLTLPVVYNTAPAANSSSVFPEKNEKGSLLEPTLGMTSASDFFGPYAGFDDILTVHPTQLSIPFELNKENSSCSSIQLINITDRIVAYTFWSLLRRELLESPDPKTYVGTILPRSTSIVTLTVKLGKKPPPEDKDWIGIRASIVKDGVKAEDITRENFISLTDEKPVGIFRMPVVYYNPVVPAANPYSAIIGKDAVTTNMTMFGYNTGEEVDLISQKTTKKADDKNPKSSINDEVHEMTSKGKGLVSSVRSPQSPRSPQDIEGSVSSFRRQSPNEMSSFVLFSDQEIKGATNGLSDSSKIGQGGYGTFYKGSLCDTEVAIKMLDPNSQQGIDEFLQEMEVLGRMRHRNLVKLMGACVPLRALVFEFVPNGSLEDCLQNSPRLLTWKMRTHIVYDICSSLTFLHSIKPQPVIHGDLNPANILLDGNFVSKLVNFGLYRFLSGGTTNDAFLDTKPKGTLGYIDPEFLKTGILTKGYDVYSFGVTILRLLTGMDALGTGLKVRSAYKKKLLMEMVDPKAGQWPTHVSELLAYFGLACCARKKSPGLMMEIAKDLEKILDIVDEEYY